MRARSRPPRTAAEDSPQPNQDSLPLRLSLCLLAALLLLPFAELAQAKEKEIKIGLFAPLTGPNRSPGEALLQGATLAVEQINRQGSLRGAKLRLVTRDDASNPALGVQILRDLVDREKCLAAIGSADEATALASMAIANEKKVPLLVPSRANEITRKGNRWVFRVGASDQLIAACLASFALQELKWQRIGLLHENEESGTERARDFSRAARRLGVNPSSLAGFDRGERDFTVQISKILKKRPDGIAVWGTADDAAYLVKQLRQLGYRGVIVGPSALEDPIYIETCKEAGDNTIFATPLPSVHRAPLTANFFEAFRYRFQSNPTEAAASGYDAVMLLAKALQSPIFKDRKAVRDSLANIENYELTQGRYSFKSSHGEGLSSLPLLTYLNQRLILLRDQYHPDPRTLRP
ncbi:MAG: ABC transporter substrate-binding protein [candidate division NC10 bacterium]|nr:ABC transporter substrate-binding protein [candidate division NC10 bacterium]